MPGPRRCPDCSTTSGTRSIGPPASPASSLARLERVRPWTLLIIGASTLAFYSLLPQLANLDDTVDSFQHAEPLWIVAALLASAVTYLFVAVSFQGAVADDVPFGANVRVQVSSPFATLVGPGGAGGYALGARFLQRTGVGGPGGGRLGGGQDDRRLRDARRAARRVHRVGRQLRLR